MGSLVYRNHSTGSCSAGGSGSQTRTTLIVKDGARDPLVRRRRCGRLMATLAAATDSVVVLESRSGWSFFWTALRRAVRRFIAISRWIVAGTDDMKSRSFTCSDG